jgi:hypothetical protein
MKWRHPHSPSPIGSPGPLSAGRKQYAVYLEDPIKRRITELATARGVSSSAMTRTLIQLGLEKLAEIENKP